MNSTGAANGRLPRRGSQPSVPSASSFNPNAATAKLPISVNSSTSTSTQPQAPSIFGRQQGWSDQVADAKMLKQFGGKGNNSSGNSSNGNNPSSSSSSSTSFSQQTAAHESVKFVHSTMEILENQIKREEAPKKKRTRTSTEQLKILQKAFAADPMPSSSARLALSKRLGMNARAVQVWFQNRRAKEKLDARRAELGMTGGSSFTSSNDAAESDLEGSESVGVAVDIEELGECGSVGPFDDDSASLNNGGNLFNSLRATGMMQRFSSNNANPTTLMKTQRSASTPNGFYAQSLQLTQQQQQQSSSSQLPFHQQQHQQSFFPSSVPASSFLAEVNEASVDDLYGELGTGSAPSPTEVPLEFYGGLVVDRTPSVSPVGFGAGRGHLFSSPPFGMESDFLMSSVFPVNVNGSAGHNTTTTNNNNNNAAPPTNSMRNPQAANVFLYNTGGSSNSSITTLPSNLNLASDYYPYHPSSAANRRSHSLPDSHFNLSPAQLQSLEHFGVQMFPSPLLSSIEESPILGSAAGGGELLDGAAEKRVFSEFLENEVIR